MKSIKNLLLSKSSINTFWIIFERIVSVSISTLIMILSARYLGTENFGVLSYGLTFVALFTATMKLGLDSIMVNELIGQKRRQGEFLGTSIVLRFFSSLLSIIAIGILLLVLNGSQPLVMLVAIIQSLVLIFQASHILDFWFQSELISKYVSLAKVTATIVTGLYAFYLLASGKGLVWFAFSTIVTGLVFSLVLLIFYRIQGGQKLCYSTNAARYLLSKSHHFIIANIISLVYIQIDKVMIANIISEQQLGIYSAAMILCTGWMFLPDAIITSLRPGIVNAKAENNATYIHKLKRLYFIIFWISVVVSSLVTVLAPFFVPLLFGAEYISAVLIVQIAVWAAPLSTLGMARNIWFVSEHKQKYVKYVLIFGVVVNIGLNILLIPYLGIAGAAISTVVTEVVTCFIAPLFFRQTRIHTTILLSGLLHLPMAINARQHIDR